MTEALGENVEIYKLSNLLDVLKPIGLNENWLLAVTSLAAQEVAVKKKLEELNVTFDNDDFQKVAQKLIDTMKEQKLDAPEILLSISRSYRPIRAKIIHAPHKTKLNQIEVDAIFINTEALVKTLFKRDTAFEISKFIQSIDTLPSDEVLNIFCAFDAERKKVVFELIMDRIPILNWNEVEENKNIFEFLKSTLKIETDSSIQNELFNILLDRTLIIEYHNIRIKLLNIIAEFTKISRIRYFIKSKGYIEQLIAEFETSGSYDIASTNAEIMLNLSTLLNIEQVNRILESSLSNDQIHYSYGANATLKKFLAIYRNNIPQHEYIKFIKGLEF